MQFYYKAKYPVHGIDDGHKTPYVSLKKVADVLKGKYEARAEVKKGVMEIWILDKDDAGVKMSRDMRNDILGYGLDITNMMVMDGLMAKQFDSIESAARRSKNTISPIGVIGNRVEFFYKPAPLGNPEPSE